MIRNDYNVLFSFLAMIILIRYFNDNPKLYSKIIIHLMTALSLVDIIWLMIIMPYWNATLGVKNKYWESLEGIHSFALFLAFVEIFIKV
jgi:hypothetical protein